MSKQYGLLVPNKKTNLQASKPAIFRSDSDSDDNRKHNFPTLSQQNVVRRQDIEAQKKAVEEDPTVYQYDELYDQMENKKNESKLARKDIEKKPKYINKLLQTAARRKRENELRIERQVQKEREAEGDEFKDKEEFVTSAYRKKLEELRELEEQEKREEYLEAIGDVTKQSDLGGFYRHLYEQQVKNDDIPLPGETLKNIKGESSKTEVESTRKRISDIKNQSDSDSDHKASNSKITKPKLEKDSHDSDRKDSRSVPERKYRKRDHSESDSNDSSEDNFKRKTHLPSNLDADSDFSIESSDSESDKDPSPKEIKQELDPITDKKDKNINETKNSDKIQVKREKSLEFEPDINKIVLPPPPKKIKVDIWKKRTVGHVFDEALLRYYDRKNARMSNG